LASAREAGRPMRENHRTADAIPEEMPETKKFE